jgi:hypothetical protein
MTMSHTPLRNFFLLACFTVLLANRPLYAQFNSTIEGIVTDQSGAPVPDAKVAIKQVETGIEKNVITNSAGYYVFPSLPPGNYTLTVTAPGFEKLVQGNVTLQPSRVQNVPIKLTVGAITTSVSVTSAPPPVQTDEANITSVISQHEVNELPLPNRNILNVVTLTAGVTGTGMMGSVPQGVDVANQFAAINANGQPNSANMYYIDGTSVNDSPSSGDAKVVPNPDAISEVVVSANQFAAQYGKGSGVVVQMFTRAGTNDFHGSLFEYFQNSALDARTIFESTANPLTGHAIPESRSNEFGGSFGGPLWKDHTFFFASWDQTRSTTGNAYLTTVETPQFVTFMQKNYPNNISTLLLTKYSPVVSSLTNIQTVSALSPGCAGTGPLGMPCNMPLLGTGVHSYSAPNNGFQGTIRLDQNFVRDRLYGAYIRIRQVTGNDNTRPAWNFNLPNNGYFWEVDWMHTFSPVTINETSLGSTYDTAFIPCQQCQVPPIGVTGMAGFGEGFAPTTFAQADFHWRDVLSLVEGKHTLKAGAEIFYNQDFAPFTQTEAYRPNYSFQNVFDFAADTPQFENGFDYDPRTGGRANVDRYWVDTYYAGFAQDDWKIRPDLTLSIGLRGEYLGNPSERHGNRSDLFLGPGSNFVQEVANAYVKVDKYAFVSGTGRIAPRIGFAWQPFGHRNWSLRGGFGIFVDRGGNTTWSDTAFNNPPLVAAVALSVFNPLNPPIVYGLCASPSPPFGCPFPALPAGINARGGPLGVTPDIGGPALNLKLAYAMNRFFGIERSFGNNWVVEADYTGSRGVDLYSVINRNRYVGERILNNGAIIGSNPYFGAINYADNSDSSDYEGLALSVTKRLSYGLTFKAAYTWSKTIDLMSGVPGQAKGSEYAAVINAYDIAAQRGLSSQDIPQEFTFDFVYQLPGPKSGSVLAKRLLGGWEISGIGTFAAGLPATVYTSTADYNGDGFFYDVPNAPVNIPTSGYSRSQYLKGVFTAADFPSPCPTVAPCGVEGNLGRNVYRGPGFAQVDAGFEKNNHIPWFTPEGADLQIRAEIANVLNRVNLTGFDTNLNDGTFGRATAVNIARTPQFSLRIHF